MCHISVREKWMELVLMPGTAHNLQLMLLLGHLAVTYHHWGSVCHRCDGLSSVPCLVIDRYTYPMD